MSVSGTCGECKKLNRNSKDAALVACNGGCGSLFHAKCINLTEYDLNKTRENKYLIILYEMCREKLISLKNIEENIRKIKENVDEIGVKFEKVLNKSEGKEKNDNKLMSQIKKTIDESLNSEKKTYANEVKKGAVLIKPKVHQDSNKTKTDVKQTVNPGDSAIQVSGIKKVDKGAIVVACENLESMNRVREKVEESLGNTYEVNVLKRNNPRIKICNLMEKLDEDVLLNCLKRQNEMLQNGNVNLELKAMWKNGNKNSFSAIIEVDHKTFNEIMKVGKLSVGWDKCFVQESLYVKRCFKCLGFNHGSRECKVENKLCAKCGGCHVGNECKAECLSCVNCVRMNNELKLNLNTNHNAFDNDCEVYQRKLKVEKSRCW